MYIRRILFSMAVAGIALTACSQSQQPEVAANAPKLSLPGRVISQDDFINAAEHTVNGVVSVKSYATPRASRGYNGGGADFFDDPFFQFFFGSPGQSRPREQQQQPEERQIGLGSGVIIDKDGYIVTNNHVINDAERLEVTLNDNRNFEATVIGADPVTDLALIKIDAPDLHVIPMGDSEDLHVGEWVLAVGNPFGFTSSVTSGIVSAKARNIGSVDPRSGGHGIESYIQTDAAVNSGNSGGALVNLAGELVGINTAIYSKTGTYAGCSFAIPTSIVRKVVSDIKEYGSVQRAFLGISFRELTPELVAEKKINGATRGIYVAEVSDRSAAREAGIEPGDVIISINGTEVPNTARLQEVIARCSPGDRVEIIFVRDGQRKSSTVTLRNRDGNTTLSQPDTMTGVLGATFDVPTDEIKKKLEISRGVQVTLTGDGRFKQAGVRDGFIILAVNGNRVSTPAEVENIYKAIKASTDDKAMFLSGIYPNGKQAYYAVDLNE